MTENRRPTLAARAHCPCPETLVQRVRRHARERGDQAALIMLADGSAEAGRLSWAELDLRAARLAGRLRRHGLHGTPVLLALPTGCSYVVSFLACLYAGAVPVPGYPAAGSLHAARLAHIGRDCGAGAILVSGGGAGGRAAQSLAAELDCLLMTAAADEDGMPDVPERDLRGDLPAWLQYTSGSTGAPRGVIVTHDNLRGFCAAWNARLGIGAHDVFVNWLPLFHDLGLVGGVLQGLHAGACVVLMPPMAFLQKPVRWLQAVSHYRGTVSHGPNFAFDLCAAALEQGLIGRLDLSCWRVAGNGAEPVRAGTVRRFCRRYAQYGFRAEALNPCYGLAEATLTVSSHAPGEAPRMLGADPGALEQGMLQPAAPGGAARLLVSSGRPLDGTRVAIVDPATCRVRDEGVIGEVWVAGPGVASGYWRRDEQTAAAFGARLDDGSGPWLRTGDLGALLDGSLYLTGRIKDLIVVQGKNHYPQDIEHTACRAHPALAIGRAAAFAHDAHGREQVVLVQEIRRSARNRLDAPAVVQAIRCAVLEQHGLALHAVQLIRPASIHITTSGKIQRRQCRLSWLEGKFDALHSWRDGTPAARTPAHEAGAAADEAAIRDWLRERIACRLDARAQDIAVDAVFAELGVDSGMLMTLAAELGAWLGRGIAPAWLFEFPTIDALARSLGAAPRAAPGVPPTAPPGAEPVAIVGYACRFPGAPSAQDLWRLLDAGIDPIANRPPGGQRVGAGELGRGGYLEGVDEFDAQFFGISPREARSMDPQQRLLLQTCWHALEDAGLPADRLAGSDAAVFVGLNTEEYRLAAQRAGAHMDAYFGTGTNTALAANRISYLLDLRGPSQTIETACSASLVALHAARRSLQAGDCDLAIVGSVNLMLSAQCAEQLQEARMLSPEGRCKSFDAGANGYVRSEACAVVVLKPYGAALRDRDRIHGLLLGSAVNQGGRSNGITAPSVQAQEAVVRRALADAGIAGASVSYVEAHGSGTPLGDPIELEALARAYGLAQREQAPLRIGSVKSNIGHTEAVSGLAGLIKVLLALRAQRLPPNLHFRRLNPAIPAGRFEIVDSARAWPAGGQPRIAGISSFGFGGANAHVLVQEAPPAAPGGQVRRPELLVLSARSPDALRRQARRYAAFLDDGAAPPLSAVCHTAGARRAHLEYRMAVAGDDRRGLARALRRRAAEAAAPDGIEGPPRLAFVFTGQGAQYPGMARGLYREHALFRSILDRCDRILRPLLGTSLLPAMCGDGGPDLGRTCHAQPALFAMEYALARVWQAWGMQPAVLLGHSLGEYVAACIAGVYSLEDGLALVAARGRLMESCSPPGAMMALHGAPAVVAALREQVAQEAAAGLALAACNAPEEIVVGGEIGAVRAFAARCARSGEVEVRPLQVSRAFHSPLMRGVLAPFEQALRKVRFQAPAMALISNVSGAPAGADMAHADYWLQHVLRPVEFARSLQCARAAGCVAYVEIGPHPVLAACARSTVGEAPWLASVRRGSDGMLQMLRSAGAWYEHGGNPDWASWTRAREHAGHAPPQPVSLPAYPFERMRYWFDSASADADNLPRPAADAAPRERETATAPPPVGASPEQVLAYLFGLTAAVLHLDGAHAARLRPAFARLPLGRIGFDSLRAMEMSNRILRDTGARIPLRHFLDATTATEVARLLTQARALAALTAPDTPAGDKDEVLL